MYLNYKLKTYQRSTDYYVIQYTDNLIKFFNENNIKVNKRIGDTSKIFKDTNLEPNSTFFQSDILCSLGAYSYTNSNLFHGIRIGRYCSIGANLQAFGAKHFTDWISTSPSFYNKDYHNEYDLDTSHISRDENCINIGNDVWIGKDVKLNKNIEIGDGAVVGTGSIITKDVEPFSIVAGIPAKIIRYRFEKNIINEIQQIQWWKYSLGDLKNLNANNPNLFIKGLNEKISSNLIHPYIPDIITVDKILSFYQFFKYIQKLKSFNIEGISFSNDYSKKYYQIYINNINRNIHFEIISINSVDYISLDFEHKLYVNYNVVDFTNIISDRFAGFETHISLDNIRIRKKVVFTDIEKDFLDFFLFSIDFILSNFSKLTQREREPKNCSFSISF